MTPDGGRSERSARHRRRLLFDTKTFSTLLVYWGEAAAEPLAVSLSRAGQGSPGVLDLLTGSRTRLAAYTRDRATSAARGGAPLTGHADARRLQRRRDAAIAERSDVSAERPLSVGEIIARHQQQQRAQDALVEQLHRARADGAALPADRRRSRLRRRHREPLLRRGATASSGRSCRSRSTARSGAPTGRRFRCCSRRRCCRCRCSSASTRATGIACAARERVDGFDCYVVSFEPGARRQRRSIAARSGSIGGRSRAIRVQAVQGGLAGAGRLERGDRSDYTPVATIGNQPVFLFTGLTRAADRARRRPQPAGREARRVQRLPRQRSGVRRRARVGARERSRHVPRDADGLRYYVKRGRPARRQRSADAAACKALAMGVTLDPSYAFPLPIFGINYLDFQFGQPGHAAGAAVRRRARGRQHPAAEARREERSTPASISSRLPRRRAIGSTAPDGEDPTDARADVAALDRAQSRLAGDAVPEGDAAVSVPVRRLRRRTARPPRTFVVPSSTVTNGIGGAWEYRRGGYSLREQRRVVRARRLEAVGRRATSTLAAPTRSTPAGAVARLLSRTRFQKLHLNGAWFGGRDLDRFSKYQFGMFDDTRIHGVPVVGRALRASWRWRAAPTRSTSSSSTASICFSSTPGAATMPGAGDWQRIPGIGDGAQPARRRGIRFCARTSARACCPTRYGRPRLDHAADHAAEAAPMTDRCSAPISTSTPATRRSAAR